jgi:hypothetical protein
MSIEKKSIELYHSVMFQVLLIRLIIADLIPDAIWLRKYAEMKVLK